MFLSFSEMTFGSYYHNVKKIKTAHPCRLKTFDWPKFDRIGLSKPYYTLSLCHQISQNKVCSLGKPEKLTDCVPKINIQYSTYHLYNVAIIPQSLYSPHLIRCRLHPCRCNVLHNLKQILR